MFEIRRQFVRELHERPGRSGWAFTIWKKKKNACTHAHIFTDTLTQPLTGLYQCCCGQQIAVCWSACLDRDNSRSITPWKLRSDHWTDRAAHSLSVAHPASTVALNRITNRGQRRVDFFLFGNYEMHIMYDTEGVYCSDLFKHFQFTECWLVELAQFSSKCFSASSDQYIKSGVCNLII